MMTVWPMATPRPILQRAEYKRRQGAEFVAVGGEPDESPDGADGREAGDDADDEKYRTVRFATGRRLREVGALAKFLRFLRARGFEGGPAMAAAHRRG